MGKFTHEAEHLAASTIEQPHHVEGGWAQPELPEGLAVDGWATAEPMGWREAQENTGPEVNVAVPTMEGVPQYVTGKLVAHEVDAPEIGMHRTKYMIGAVEIDPTTATSASAPTGTHRPDGYPHGFTAAASRHDMRDPAGKYTTASRKLTHIDRDLRVKLQTAANATVRRALERAGARIVNKSKTAQGASVRSLCARHPLAAIPRAVFAATPSHLLASLGIDERTIVDREFADLAKLWERWTLDAAKQATTVAAKIAKVDPEEAWAHLQPAYIAQSAAGWTVLNTRLNAVVDDELTTDPDPNVDPEADPDEGDDTEPVKPGAIRAALAIVGGFGLGMTSSGMGSDGYPVDPNEVMGQIGTGDTLSGFLGDNGIDQAGYEWIHGTSANPFPPHEELDGKQFDSFTDPDLTVDGDFPDSNFYHPGDHDGCSCDFVSMWGEGNSGGSGPGFGVPGGYDDEEGDDEALAASADIRRRDLAQIFGRVLRPR